MKDVITITNCARAIFGGVIRVVMRSVKHIGMKPTWDIMLSAWSVRLSELVVKDDMS
jgi:hypothetical protein